jgi:hypothetical protein
LQADTKVATISGIFSTLLVVVAGATVIQPQGGDLKKKYLKVFLENLRRRSVRVLKLHRGFILTKKRRN